jgi:phage FluMu protein Com
MARDKHSDVSDCTPASDEGCVVSGQRSLRCDCGSLLARYVGGRVELKCRRCKRTVLLPIEVSAEAGSAD